jgi:hypothetical protein
LFEKAVKKQKTPQSLTTWDEKIRDTTQIDCKAALFILSRRDKRTVLITLRLSSVGSEVFFT